MRFPFVRFHYLPWNTAIYATSKFPAINITMIAESFQPNSTNIPWVPF